jgi:enamine deaminase RidA (YjgF/YER057c/UK114 family)
VVIHQGLAFVSGQLPRLDNVVQYCGKVGASISLEQAREAARLCASQCLAALDRELGGMSRVVRLLRVTGYVASAEGFDQQPAVMDAASEYFCQMLGPAGTHARSAVGVAQLPRGASVEIEITVAIKE